MPLFKRKPRPAPLIPDDALKPGEEVERSVRATLLQGKTAIKGGVYMTNRRLLFQAEKGEARWLVVPYDEISRRTMLRLGGWSRGMLRSEIRSDDGKIKGRAGWPLSARVY